MKQTVLKICLCSFLFLGAFVVLKSAHANILITPTRVIFEDRDRFASVTLVNIGEKTRTYNVEWMFFKMLEGQGNYEEVDSPPSDFDLSKHIVYSPRRVTLLPGASQKVKLALRRPEQIPAGDYHIHLKFSYDPEAPESIVKKHKEDIAGGVKRSGAAVSINVSYSIPVVLVVGKPDVQASIGDLSMKRNEKSGGLDAVFLVNRFGGPYSILGHIYIYHLDDSGQEVLVGEVSNAHVFPEVNSRLFDVALTKEISGGDLRVVVKHSDKDKAFVYAERRFSLE